MKEIESLLYVSLGNLPSKLASSIQVAKMSQALAQEVKNFELVTSGDLLKAFRGMEAEFQTYCSGSLTRLLQARVRRMYKYLA